jgi:hypothetical protein
MGGEKPRIFLFLNFNASQKAQVESECMYSHGHGFERIILINPIDSFENHVHNNTNVIQTCHSLAGTTCE